MYLYVYGVCTFSRTLNRLARYGRVRDGQHRNFVVMNGQCGYNVGKSAPDTLQCVRRVYVLQDGCGRIDCTRMKKDCR